MPRARSIKPGFFENEDLAECSFAARLCFAGLWMLADREGRLEDRPKRIKGALFRFDTIDVDPLLDELQALGFLLRYENEDGRYIQILAFKKHQFPHHTEKPSIIKPPPLQGSTGLEAGAKPGALQECSRSAPGVDTAGRGGRSALNPVLLNPVLLNPGKDGGAPPRRSPPRVDPPAPPPAFDGNNVEALNGKAVVVLAAGWELPTEWGFDAEALGWKPGEVLREAERFRQYWTVGKGAGKRRSVKGWRQSWSNWLGKAAGDAR